MPRKNNRGGWISKPLCPDSRACALSIEKTLTGPHLGAALLVRLLLLRLWSQEVILGPVWGLPEHSVPLVQSLCDIVFLGVAKSSCYNL